MAADTLTQQADSAALELQAAITNALRNLAAGFDREALVHAVTTRDAAAVFAVFGIAPDRTDWPALAAVVAEAFHDTLRPLILATADTERSQNQDATIAVDAPAIYSEALRRAVADLTAGTVTAIESFIVSGAATSTITHRMLAVVGMTQAQARIYAMAHEVATGVLNTSNLAAFDKVRGKTPRAAFLAPAFQTLHPVARNAILRMLEQTEHRQVTAADIDRVFTALARSLITYNTRSIAGMAAMTTINATVLAVWIALQAAGFLPADARKYWHDQGDDRVRVDHHAIKAMNAAGVPLDQPFAHTLGKTIYHPPADYGCRCRVSLRPKATARAAA